MLGRRLDDLQRLEQEGLVALADVVVRLLEPRGLLLQPVARLTRLGDDLLGLGPRLGEQRLGLAPGLVDEPGDLLSRPPP